MKPKMGDTIKIDMKALVASKTKPGQMHFINIVTKMLKRNNNKLYVSKVNSDGTLNIRSWQQDVTGDVTIPYSIVKGVIKQDKYVKCQHNKSLLTQVISKKSPDNLAPGDYVQLQGKDIMGMINGGQILKSMKKTMNIMYIQDIQGNTAIITPYKFMTDRKQKFEVPLNFIRWKLTGVSD